MMPDRNLEELFVGADIAKQANLQKQEMEESNAWHGWKGRQTYCRRWLFNSCTVLFNLKSAGLGLNSQY